ncbi:Z1 domain-containing protein [Rhizobium sp. UGM030330-04]|uniref:Z1 domain-containing protein n=1 Tax=Rhizobium sp. UGM030330-04 TaxID=1378077 RepID=UPI000D8E7F53|nr:Z1 domain-containing protein [Rhizobium sp. UGM030330-04]PYG54732.1 replication restart DNA helicase PriA [Rhizobium sp. UGM030330-04]
MDWAAIVGDVGEKQYSKRLATLHAKNIDTKSIEDTVEKTVSNIEGINGRSLVIFGEPQSGKTEMMIALNARLLDEGASLILNLLTDSVDLLEQSLSRFRDSGLSPSPKQFSELPHEAKDLGSKKWVIFSKKNARDLEKLKKLLRFRKDIIIIDDEADFASPNAKVNSADKTKINELIHELLGENGRYIGVTATPARLNLNNTFGNNSEMWVDFLPHANYVGQDFFFPFDGKVDYRLHEFESHQGSERGELENAIIHFLCGVAEQHARGNLKNFTMLVHTSGKRDEHQNDIDVIQNTITGLSSPEGGAFERLKNKLVSVAKHYSKDDPNSVVEFVLRNIYRHVIVEINSKGQSGRVSDIARPTSLFSFGAGGNIISRGVTFDNLLSMYFTRSVKGKFAQDTYIQRARMFGSRNDYKEYFQLWLPKLLMREWSKCFAFHKLAIQAVRTSAGAPVWLSDHKTTPTATSSIDHATVSFEGGEMSFALFEYDEKIHEALMARKGETDVQMLQRLREHFSETEFPTFLLNFLAYDINNSRAKLSFHKSSDFGSTSTKYPVEEVASIRRSKGIFSTNEYGRSEYPDAKHHLKIFHNELGKARLFYKINGKKIKFIQNRK